MEELFMEFHNVPSEDTPLNAENVNELQRLIKTAIKSAVNDAVEKSKKTGYPGTITAFGSATIPSDMRALRCDGSAVSRTEYAELFAVIGTFFGKGDEKTTFNLPDIRGRNIVGYDERDADFNEVGKTGGAKTHTSTVDEMPPHDHIMEYQANYGVASGGYYGVATNNGEPGSNVKTKQTGKGKPYDIMNPHVVSPFIIFY